MGVCCGQKSFHSDSVSEHIVYAELQHKELKSQLKETKELDFSGI